MLSTISIKIQSTNQTRRSKVTEHTIKSVLSGGSSEIAYQNKDIVSKIIGEGMVGKPLSAMGWDTDLTVTGIEPTNLPDIKVDELRLDNLFLLSNGDIAVIDYESTEKDTNMIKYMDYVVRILKRYGTKSNIRIRVLVLYTADIENAVTEFDAGCIQFAIQAAYMTGIDSQKWLDEIRDKVAVQNLDYETMIHMIMLPLTYKGDEAKNKAIETCVELATAIKDDEKQKFVLAGILSFSDKVINEDMRQLIERMVSMTKIGNALMERGLERGLEQGLEQGSVNARKSAAIKMFEMGDSIEKIAAVLTASNEMVQKWLAEAKTEN